MDSPLRFPDNRETMYHFLDEILVICPHCRKCARNHRLEPDNHNLFAPRRLVCTHCGLTKTWAELSIASLWRNDPPLDNYFQVPLWLSIPCANNILWAYDQRHLEVIESFVTATLRERTHDPKYGWANTSLVSSLPKWIGLAKNRASILKAIAHLKTRLTTCGN